ncbi:hypothetical protein [Desulfoluna butyratoxydans]|uniref:hypothetical protein n=1 Tax=Desulfoluna butyratoxydans TaxID=231438 RepID=UPI0015D375C8|nr:hypothetical protein [Desulfoluna butyratoxydans]
MNNPDFWKGESEKVFNIHPHQDQKPFIKDKKDRFSEQTGRGLTGKARLTPKIDAATYRFKHKTG